MAAKISQTWGFKRVDLKTENFYKTYGNFYGISSTPWYINMDGTFFLYFLSSVKDSEEEVRELTSEEKKKYERQYESFSTGYKYEPPKEKAVKINVKTVKAAVTEEPGEKGTTKADDSQPENEA
jgi:predicted Zn-dependent peptidase